MRLPSFTSIEQLLAITFACVIFKQPCIIMRLARWILDFAHLVVFTALDVKPLSCSLPRLPFMEGDTHVKVEIFRYVRFRDFFLHWEVRLYLVGWERSILLLFGKLILFSDEKRVADFYTLHDRHFLNHCFICRGSTYFTLLRPFHNWSPFIN